MGWSRFHHHINIHNSRKMIIITIIGGMVIGRWIGKILWKKWGK